MSPHTFQPISRVIRPAWGVPARIAVPLAAVAALFVANAAWAQDAPLATLPPKCAQTATAKLEAMGLANVVKSGMHSEIRSGVSIVSGYRARYYNPNCGGYIVMNMTPNCEIEQTYTTGQCRMNGMSHW
ncbi:hypothetical protein [Azospirillum canadense]|uniref:hypothetical protein n=1 Tax=Azospirillum canadense TaxID=403962 RepID=UPI00222777AE|nr:hypothetical protein [Azospirillum canadense]MCW2238371.1 hypothetical protein [Azospirillum canadense]